MAKSPSDYYVYVYSNPDTLFTPPKEHSIPRNPLIADVLYLRKSIETWGRGLGVMASECRRVGLPLPTTRIEGGYVITTFQRPMGGIAPVLSRSVSGTACQITDTSGSLSGSDLDQGDPDIAARLLETVRLNPLISRRMLADELKVSERKVRATIAKLKECGYILRQGADHGGIWRIGRVVDASGEKSTQKSTQKTSLETSQKTGLKTSLKIVEVLKDNPSATISELMQRFDLSRNGVKWNLAELKRNGLIRRVGPDKGGHWEVLKELP